MNRKAMTFVTGAIALLTLTGSAAAVLGPNAASAATVVGISAPPDVVVGEADGYVNLPVTLDAPAPTAITVSYSTLGGTGSGAYNYCALSNSVFEAQSGTLTFPAGATSETVKVPLLSCGQSLASGFETFFLSLSSNSAGSTLVRSTTQVDVTGDVAAKTTPGLYALGATVDAGAGTVQVPVVLGGPSGAASTVPVTVNYATHDGTAVAGQDYSSTSGTLTFAPGQTAQNITVPILDPSAARPARSFSVGLSSPTNAVVSAASATVQVGASGSPATALPQISAPPDVVVGAADGYVNLPVTLSAPGETPVSVSYSTLGGTGSGAYNYCALSNSVFEAQSGTLTFPAGVTTAVIRVPLLSCGQSLASGFETFFLSLSSNSAGSTLVRSTTQVDVTGDVAAKTTPGLYALGATVDAGAGTVQVPVVLGGPSGAASTVPVTVNYATHDGTAVAGQDYSSTSGTLTFAPGQTAQNITVPILDPSAARPARSFSVGLSSPTNAVVSAASATVQVGASGSPATALPQISAPPDVVVGAADGYVNLPVTLSAPGETPVSVSYSTLGGTGSGAYNYCALSNSVFEAQSGTLTFPAGVTTAVIRVPLLSCGQSLASGFETFFLSLSSNSAGSTLVRSTTQVDVTGDVAAKTTPGLYALGATVDAGAGTVQVPVVLGGPSGAASTVPVTVNYATHDGTAVAGQDYSSTSGTLTFAPGQTAQNVTVALLHASGKHSARTFTVKFSAATNAKLAVALATVRIGAGGQRSVSLPAVSAPADLVLGEAAGYVDLPVTLSAPGQSTVTLSFTTENLTGSGSYNYCALTNSAYEGQSGQLVFPSGVTTEVVRVPILNCGYTGSYTFELALSGVTGGTIKDGTTTVTTEGAPTITSFGPASGAPGSTVTITGTNLEGTTVVKFKTAKATVVSDTAAQLQVTVPAKAASGKITVTTPGGTVVSASSFTVS